MRTSRFLLALSASQGSRISTALLTARQANVLLGLDSFETGQSFDLSDAYTVN